MSNSNAVLWVSLALVVIVLTRQYRSVVSGMLFDPDYWKGAPAGPTTDAFGTRIGPAAPATDAFGTRI